MSTHRIAALACLTASFVFAPLCLADSWSVKVENDLLSSSDDGHYTNGVELFWSFEPDPEHWSLGLADLLPGFAREDFGLVSYRFGHQMYTPNDIGEPALIEDDRPYAGVVFAGLSYFNERREGRWRDVGALHLNAGMVGPAAGAGKLQLAVHKLTDSERPEGWDNQLENEPFVNLAFEQRWWRQGGLGGLELEYGPGTGFALGNLYTYGSASLGLRVGQGLSRSLGVPSVAPSPSGSQYFQLGGGFGWYAFAHLEGRYMAHNMLLDGNTFEDSHSVDRREWVGDAQLGVALMWSRWQLAFTSVWRSREFEAQQEHDQFGSITLTRAF